MVRSKYNSILKNKKNALNKDDDRSIQYSSYAAMHFHYDQVGWFKSKKSNNIIWF